MHECLVLYCVVVSLIAFLVLPKYVPRHDIRVVVA